MLRGGVAANLESNEAADGFTYVLIPRSAAKRAHIKAGRGPMVTIGRGTVSGIKQGAMKLHLRLSRAIAAKLAHLGHVTADRAHDPDLGQRRTGSARPRSPGATGPRASLTFSAPWRCA